LSGKPGKVREWERCQGKVREFTKSGNCNESVHVRENCMHLEQQKKLKLEEKKSQAAELDKHIAELKSPK
jgi:RNA polymerase-interacting CarD/CdnL/TRCF family regulator